MNPYLEAHWPDVHTALIGFVRTDLSQELPDDLSARAEEAVTILGADATYRSDIVIAEDRDKWKQGQTPSWSPTNDATVTTPTLIRVPAETERWIEIRDDQGKLVTAIEILSPSNKTTGRTQYLKKVDNYRAAHVNLVEIDLLRGGQHAVAVSENAYRKFHPKDGTDGLVCVSFGDDPESIEVYHCPLRETLPTIRVPLRHGDPVVALDIQEHINRCYQTGRYWKMDFTQDPVPPLAEKDTEWNDSHLRSLSLR